MSLDFVTCDVFTDTRHGGNPLAVVFGAEHLDAPAMQAIAGEFNLSETVFVLPSPRPDAAFRLRIFTPATELPFAGHPTIGAALTLARLGRVPVAGGMARFVFDEAAGPVPVGVRFEDGVPVFAELTAPRPVTVRGGEADLAGIAAALGLPAPLPVPAGGSPVVADCGVPFLLVPLTGLAALGAIRPAAQALTTLADAVGASGLFVFTPAAAGVGTAYRARMFAAGLGIAEDPATGAAACAFAGWLAGREGPADGLWQGLIEQGVEMGRPSRLMLAVERIGGVNTAIRLGGAAVAVSTGTLFD